MRLFKRHNSAKHGTVRRHLNEIRNYAHEHFTRKRMFHVHGTILGIAGLKLLAAEAFILKMLAGPILFAKGLLVAALTSLPFVSDASDIGVREAEQPPVIQAQRASSLEEQQAQQVPQPQKKAGTTTVSNEDTQKADIQGVEAENNYVETPLVDPNKQEEAKQEGANGEVQADVPKQPGVGTTTLEGVE